MMTHYLTVLLIFVSFLSCSIGEQKREPSKNFAMSKAQAPWKRVPTDKADYLYSIPKTGKLFYANSYCSQYQNNYLETIFERQFGGIKNFKVIARREKLFRGREAIEIESRGYLDGVVVHLISQSLRKNQCLYDFLYISPDSLTEFDRDYFKEFLKRSQF